MSAPVMDTTAAARGGTVFDIGYQRYTGEREGRARGRVAVFKDGVRTALGFGRGPRAKVLPWFFIALLSGIAVIMSLVAAAAQRMGRGENVAELPAQFYGIAAIIMFVFAAIVAPELLCRDRREGTINLYLVRPITGSDYIVARWLAFLSVITVAAWLPQLILLTSLTLDAPVPGEFLRENWRILPQFLAAGLAISLYTTTLAMLTASFTTRRAYASVFLVGLFIISTPFTAGLASEIDGPLGSWISMFNLTNIPVHVNDIVFGDVSDMTEEAPARALGSTVLAAWYAGWVVVPAAVLWARYRRLSA